jgi:hypothetical protein
LFLHCSLKITNQRFSGLLMDKLDADLALFRKAFNERILFVQVPEMY